MKRYGRKPNNHGKRLYIEPKLKQQPIKKEFKPEDFILFGK